MAMPSNGRKIWQPIHPAIRDKLDPEYVKFHERYAQYVQPDDSKVWDSTARSRPSLPPGGLSPAPVGSTKDFTVSKFRVRVYTPQGISPKDGWPVFIWFHGGGWAIGGLGDNVDFCTLICQESKCCVVTVDYRLAPETPFPGAVEDSIDAVRWVGSCPAELGNIDTSKIVLGGTSAGANLAIVAALSTLDSGVELPSAQPSLPSGIPPRLLALMLIVPVVDNSATAEGIWKRNSETAPWLTPARMEWYRKLYFKNAEGRSAWDASPNFAPKTLLRKLPRTWIAVSEQDLLAPEAELFSTQLEGLGVNVELVHIEGGTHSILTLGGKITRARTMMQDAANYLKEVLYS